MKIYQKLVISLLITGSAPILPMATLASQIKELTPAIIAFGGLAGALLAGPLNNHV